MNVKFEGEILIHDDDVRAKFDRVDEDREIHDHTCRSFISKQKAEDWLLDKGVDLDDIEITDHTSGAAKASSTEEVMEFMADILGDAAKQMKERLDAIKRLKVYAPKAGYDFDNMKDFESDAIQLMVILAKYSQPIHPEELEAKLSNEQEAKRNA